MQIIGHLGKDAVLNFHGTDSVLNFSLAHTDKYKDGNGQLMQRTTWVSCAYWVDSKSTLGQYLKKGVVVYCEGFPEARGYEHNNKVNGELKMRVQFLQLLGGGNREGINQNTKPSQNAPAQTQNAGDSGYVPVDDSSDLPF